MRLATRLLLSHAVVAALLLGTLGGVMAALVRMTSSMTEVRDRQLGSLQIEEELHRAAWSVEIAARHGLADCEGGATDDGVSRALSSARARLEDLLASRAFASTQPIYEVAARYSDFARRMAEPGTCARLALPVSQRERAALDERITQAWVDRLFELHRFVEGKEEEARAIGASATTTGFVAALLSLLAAAFLSARAARSVTRPLARLSQAARRLGGGDFSPIAAEAGPMEVTALAGALEGMRGRLAELDQLKQNFLASVSHELRTPLTKVREALALLHDGATGDLNEGQRRIVALARRACEREIHIVTAMLDLSRLRAGHPLQTRSGCRLDAVLAAALECERPDAEERGVSLVVDALGPVPPAKLDAPLLERAIANLVRNAVSVSQPGQRVHVALRVADRGPDERTGPCAVVSVRDEGPGIPEAIRRTLFDAFVTHDVARGRPRTGVGLGLPIAHETARGHGGDLRLVRSHPGAEFEMWIPLGATVPFVATGAAP